jgi:hypothetical protein
MRLIFGRGARCDIYMKIRKKKKKKELIKITGLPIHSIYSDYAVKKAIIF